MAGNVVPIKKPTPLPSVVIEDAVAIKALRLELLANGYVPMEAHDKRARRKAWNITDVTPAEITSWLHARQGSTRWPATVLRVEKGLLSLDLDIPDKALAEDVRAIVMSIAPQVFEDGALERGRDDGSSKVMFIMRREGDEPFTVKSKQWMVDPADEKGPVFGIEVFASERTLRGGVQRYVGAFGPHTVDERGRVLIRYAWKGPSPKEVSIDALPAMSVEEAIAICAAFDVLAELKGLVIKPGRSGRVEAIDVYDLDENMRFDGEEFHQITLAQLIETYWLNQSLNLDTRCSSTFLGEGGSRQDRCHVGWSGPKESGHITVHDYRNEVTHRPVGASPPSDDEMFAEFAEVMALYDQQRTQENGDRLQERWNEAVGIATRGVLSEFAIARGVMVLLDDRYRYDGYEWLRFDGTIWAKATAHAIEKEVTAFAVTIPLPSDKAGIAERKRVGSAKTAAAVERILRPILYIDPKLFDADPYIVAAGDVVVDLLTGKSRPGTPADHLTKRWLCAPAERIDCPQWLRFLDQAMRGDKDMVRFLQQWVGMGLSGAPLHQKLAYFHGAGGNGKNVFIDTVAAVVGDYAHTSDISLLMATRGDKHPTDMWALRGRRTVLMSEPDENATWDTAKVKALTGDGRITARGMRRDFETFPRQWTITVIGNNKPQLKHVDDAMRRRLLLVPFEYSVPKEERDEELVAKLVGEAAGILRWAIEGYLEVRKSRLIEPQAIVEATRDYLSSEDLIGSFVAEEVTVKPGAVVRHSDVFERWRAYAAANGAEPGIARALADRMRRRVPQGVEFVRRTAGMVWTDMELRSIDWSTMKMDVDEV